MMKHEKEYIYARATRGSVFSVPKEGGRTISIEKDEIIRICLVRYKGNPNNYYYFVKEDSPFVQSLFAYPIYESEFTPLSPIERLAMEAE